MKKKFSAGLVTGIFMIGVTVVASATVVPDGTTVLDGDGTSTNPALWTLGSDFVSTDRFKIGDAGKSFNQLTVDGTYSFTAESDLYVGLAPVFTTPGSYNNLLTIESGGNVAVGGNLFLSDGSVWGGGKRNRVDVTGMGSVLSIAGDLDMYNYIHAYDNTLNVSDGGVAIVDGSFSIYHSEAYNGYSWLEFGGGALFLSGDLTSSFVEGSDMLTSVKVWDEVTSTFQRVSEYDNGSVVSTTYLDLLEVSYIQDANQASSMGLTDDFVGYTVLRDVNPVPEPGTVLLFGAGLAGLIGSRVRKKRMK